MYNVQVEIVSDANIFLAVLLNESKKNEIIDKTVNIEISSPTILPYEIGNALSSMVKKQRILKKDATDCYEKFLHIPVRLLDIDIAESLRIAVGYKIYAYDAYYLELAKRHRAKLLTLDIKLIEIAKKMNIPILEML